MEKNRFFRSEFRSKFWLARFRSAIFVTWFGTQRTRFVLAGPSVGFSGFVSRFVRPVPSRFARVLGSGLEDSYIEDLGVGCSDNGDEENNSQSIVN